MKIDDHALVYRLPGGAWAAARWHFGLARWLPVMQLQGALKAMACSIIREAPRCNYTIVNAEIDPASESLESVDRLRRYTGVTIHCPTPTEGMDLWRSVSWDKASGRTLGLLPTGLKHVSSLVGTYRLLKNLDVSVVGPEEFSPGEASLLRWEWDALAIGSHAEAA